jgi:hypothetical protein
VISSGTALLESAVTTAGGVAAQPDINKIVSSVANVATPILINTVALARRKRSSSARSCFNSFPLIR